MLNHNSATERDETPHSTSTQNNTSGFNRCIAVAYSRRAESVINDRSIDPQTRAVIRYAFETSDPWLAELLRRVDAGESLFDTVDFSQEPRGLMVSLLGLDVESTVAENFATVTGSFKAHPHTVTIEVLSIRSEATVYSRQRSNSPGAF